MLLALALSERRERTECLWAAALRGPGSVSRHSTVSLRLKGKADGLFRGTEETDMEKCSPWDIQSSVLGFSLILGVLGSKC